MASFDDLAFAPPPRDIYTSNRPANDRTDELYCRDCDEIATRTTPDRKRCLVCGCELERRSNQPQQSDRDLPSNMTDLESIFRHLMETHGGQFGALNEARRPAAESAVERLGSFCADQSSTIEVTVKVSGIKGEVIAVPAGFGPCESVPRVPLCLSDPLDGSSVLKNASDIHGKIVVMERGTCTFAQKILRAQDAGAVAVVVLQTFDVWPYTMTDSKGEGSNINIPAFMLSKQQGSRFLEYLRLEHSEPPVAEITANKNDRECAICQGDMSIGMTLTRMPCQHMYHTNCLHQWLKIGNSCPICRCEIPSKNGTSTASSQDAGSASWGAWIS